MLLVPSRLRTCLRTCLCLRPSDLSLRLCECRRPLGRCVARRVERLLALECLGLEAPLLGHVARAQLGRVRSGL